MSFRFLAYWFAKGVDHDDSVYHAFTSNASILENDSVISIQLVDKTNVRGCLKDLCFMVNNSVFMFKGVEYMIGDVDIFRVDKPIFKEYVEVDDKVVDNSIQTTLI